MSPKSARKAEHERPRRPGRPLSGERSGVSRSTILEAAYELAREIPLQDLSVVVTAKALAVTPALIHYYIGGRDPLTSGVVNMFYRDVLKDWPEEQGAWDIDLFNAAQCIYRHFLERAGVAAYMVSHNRFRTYQLVQPGEKDHGVELIERFVGCVLKAGLPIERSAIYGHLLMEFIISAAYNTTRRRYPAEHRAFLHEQAAKLDPSAFPNIAATYKLLDSLDAAAAFNEGCRTMLLGMQSELLRSRFEVILPSSRTIHAEAAGSAAAMPTSRQPKATRPGRSGSKRKSGARPKRS